MPHATIPRRRLENGFTMMELMIVITIMGVLAASVARIGFFPDFSKNQEDQLVQDIRDTLRSRIFDDIYALEEAHTIEKSALNRYRIIDEEGNTLRVGNTPSYSLSDFSCTFDLRGTPTCIGDIPITLTPQDPEDGQSGLAVNIDPISGFSSIVVLP